MIGYIKGKVLFKGHDFLTVDANNVGYRVFVSIKTLERAKKGAEIELFTWLYLKRNTIELCGVPSQEEFEVFEVLEKMAGIGPKSALAMSAAGSLENLKTMIENGDQEFLKSLSGIGKKRIQRVLLELTGKIKEIKKTEDIFEEDEVFHSLIALGFPKTEVKKVLSSIDDEIKDSQERVKIALKLLKSF